MSDKKYANDFLAEVLSSPEYKEALGGFYDGLEYINRVSIATQDIPIVRLEWICASEKDRRCLVLPCKVGDVVYRIFNGEIETRLVSNAIYESLFNQWKVFTTPYMCIYWEDSFGKTVFLTREEAEAALEGRLEPVGSENLLNGIRCPRDQRYGNY